VSFATITLCVASQRVFIVVSIYFVIDTVWKLLDTPSYITKTDKKFGVLHDRPVPPSNTATVSITAKIWS
jgi:hypothetical protein